MPEVHIKSTAGFYPGTGGLFDFSNRPTFQVLRLKIFLV